MALVHFQQFGAVKSVGLQGRLASRIQPLVKGGIACQQAAFQQGGLHGVVTAGGLLALGHGAHAGTNVQPRIPAGAHKSGGVLGQGVIGVVWQQHQHVDVRVRVQLAATQTAHGYQRHGLAVQPVRAPQLVQQLIGEARQLSQRGRGFIQQRLFFVLVTLAQLGKVGRGVHIRRCRWWHSASKLNRFAPTGVRLPLR